jgi:hypothetical protein
MATRDKGDMGTSKVIQSQRGSASSAFNTVLVVLLILALLGAVGYLTSDINHRRYRLNVRAGSMWVERGLFLPVGFMAYEPDTPILKDAYAPITVPGTETVSITGPFDERLDVDRALFVLLSGWARTRIASQETLAQQQAVIFVKRLELLPGLTEDQRVELHALRAGVAYQDGARLMDESVQSLKRAQEAFRLALSLGGAQAREAQRLINEIDRRLDALKP